METLSATYINKRFSEAEFAHSFTDICNIRGKKLWTVNITQGTRFMNENKDRSNSAERALKFLKTAKDFQLTPEQAPYGLERIIEFYAQEFPTLWDIPRKRTKIVTTETVIQIPPAPGYPQQVPGYPPEPGSDYTAEAKKAKVECDIMVYTLLQDTLKEADHFVSADSTCQSAIAGVQPLSSIQGMVFGSGILIAVSRHFTREVELSLYTLSTFLPSDVGADVNDVQAIRELINELMSTVEVSELPASIRTFLFNMQATSLSMLDRYRISGTRGLRDAFHKLLGEMADVYRRDEKKNTDRKTLWEKVKRIISLFDDLVGKAQKYPAITEKTCDATEAVQRFLE